MDFKNAVIMTDLDGTLLDDRKNVSERDMESINEFRAKGGMFTIATGRGYSMAKPIAKKLSLDMPAVIFNGAAVYDFDKEAFLWQSELSEETRGQIKLAMDKFPDIGIEVLHSHNVYVPALNEVERWHMSLENVTADVCRVEDIPNGGWLKVLFAYPAEKMEQLRQYIDSICSQNASCVLSAPFFYELLPKGISKAYGYKMLLKLTGSEDRFTVAAGDFPNDAEMVRCADYGVAVSNAHDDVKKAAKAVICSNNEDPMTEIIERIRKM